MEIANEFSLSVPLERAWPLLTDLERVAPAMPGVTVDAVDDDGLRVTMRVKVGPISVTYRTVVSLVSADPATHTAVLKARGREARGQGTVEATVTALLRAAEDEEERTEVDLLTDVAVTGRIAQFGGGVMKEVADRLLRQFAGRLEAQLVEEPAPSSPPRSPTDAPKVAAAPRPSAPAEPDAVDLGRVATAALLPSGPTAGAFAGAFLGTFLGALLAALLLRRRG
ncbi:SRPBCC family protein [Conexibacter stalactiti]|uniref:SRPBCC family protein n=1 Tax=Conexibacter stalactiti TaxID=1940611 RepID=A0ABU4HUX8_9ACTN|nr:SRPBCC family protein [Conexibacter stalactiti]MDW5597098.1 SRPBCC family protein [Conexibacter stalactiti]MEC5037740.1 SRPBCC family protein [Conexibacter stalactiti]